MSHQVRASLTDIHALAAAIQELQHYLGPGGYQLDSASVAEGVATWQLLPRAAVRLTQGIGTESERRRTVEPGDHVLIETKGQQISRRIGGAAPAGVEGTVFRVLTRGPHPHGMKVELRDRTVGRVKQNLTAPGAGEPAGSTNR